MPTNYVLDLNAGLTQVLADGTNTYLYGLSRIGEQQSTGFAYYLTDALGSVRQLTNASGAVTLAKSYEPYGTVLSGAGTGTSNYAFTGEWQDSYTNLVYLRARFYASGLGRFLSRDTWPGVEYRPQSYNHWLYSPANPINYTDPSGRIPCSVQGLGTEDREDCEFTQRNTQGLLPPETEWYSQKSKPQNIHWDPWVNVPPAKILNTVGDVVKPGTHFSQGLITNPQGSKVKGACGTTSFAAILNDPAITANDVFLDAYNVQYPTQLDDGEWYMVHADPDITGANELAWIIRSYEGWNARVVNNMNQDSDAEAYAKLRLSLSANQYPIPGVAIGGSSGKVGNGGVGHWLVVTGLSREWPWGRKWQWVRVYNPFDNDEEYYWAGDFFTAWPGVGEGFTRRLMVVAYRE